MSIDYVNAPARRVRGPQPNAAFTLAPPFSASPLPPSIDLRLDRNERRGALSEAERVRALDPGEYASTGALERLLARRLGIDPARVLVTAGAHGALERITRAYLGPGRRLLSPTPTFAMIPHLARLVGAAVDTVPWPGGTLHAEVLLAARRRETGVITIVSPNNPTGAVIDAETLFEVSERAPDALLVLDHAYAEYADEDLTAAALTRDNVVVVRTLSKAWGLAGLRVGYVVGPASIIATLRAAGSPYPVSSASLSVAAARLARGEAAMRAHVRLVRGERRALVSLLRSLGARVEPSQGSFVLARVGDRERVHATLKARGIVVRETLAIRDGLRITCPGDLVNFSRLRSALLACGDAVARRIQRPQRSGSATSSRRRRRPGPAESSSSWSLQRARACAAGVSRARGAGSRRRAAAAPDARRP